MHLQEALNRLGWSQVKAASEAHGSQAQLSRWLKAESLDYIGAVVRMGLALGVPPTELCLPDGDPLRAVDLPNDILRVVQHLRQLQTQVAPGERSPASVIADFLAEFIGGPGKVRRLPRRKGRAYPPPGSVLHRDKDTVPGLDMRLVDAPPPEAEETEGGASIAGDGSSQAVAEDPAPYGRKPKRRRKRT